MLLLILQLFHLNQVSNLFFFIYYFFWCFPIRLFMHKFKINIKKWDGNPLCILESKYSAVLLLTLCHQQQRTSFPLQGNQEKQLLSQIMYRDIFLNKINYGKSCFLCQSELSGSFVPWFSVCCFASLFITALL